MKQQQVTFDLAIEDVEAFFRVAYARNTSTERTRKVCRLTAAVLMAIAGFIGACLEGTSDWAEDLRYLPVVLLGVMAVVLWQGSSPTGQVANMRRAFERQGGCSRLGPCIVAIGPEGVSGSGPIGTQTVRWRAILGVDVELDLVLLWLDNLQAILVPARAFSDRWAMDAFAESARAFHARAKLPQSDPNGR